MKHEMQLHKDFEIIVVGKGRWREKKFDLTLSRKYSTVIHQPSPFVKYQPCSDVKPTVKVSKSLKQMILLSILPKNEQKTSILVARILG